MALSAFIPYSVMLPTVDGEELAIVVKVGRLPGCLGVARSTIIGKPRGLMRWIVGGIVVINVTASTGVWSVGIIPIVTRRTVVGNGGVCTCQDVVIIVYRESRWAPSGICGMAGCTVVG